MEKFKELQERVKSAEADASTFYDKGDKDLYTSSENP